MLGNNNNTCIRCLYLCVVSNRVNLIEFLLDHCVSRIEQKESRKRSYIVGDISKTNYLVNSKMGRDLT